MNIKKLQKAVKVSLWIDGYTQMELENLCFTFGLSQSKALRVAIIYASATRTYYESYINKKTPRLCDMTKDQLDKIIDIAKTPWINYKEE